MVSINLISSFQASLIVLFLSECYNCKVSFYISFVLVAMGIVSKMFQSPIEKK